ncbi:cell wall metabolism sensor histidine kinase WalK [uncultured Anaerococcus sp.]|uniref:sensor histidine kinase n=1 Tax=uncultured Anaerococcus sp. TaxID=293428 RepID=UPI0026076671|nr:ATP-binding protein [uncultured Anaerococcus sp.]
MKKLTKKSLSITTTIATAFAVVVGFYTKEYEISFLFLGLSLGLLILSHLYIDKRLDIYARKISKFDKYYDFNKVGEDFEDVGKVYRNLLNKNVKLEKNISILKRQMRELENITSNMEEGFIVFDPKGEVELINDSAKNFLNKDETVRIDKLIDSREYKLALKEARILSRSKSLSFDANSYHLKIFIDPIYDGGNMGFVVIIIDNSETRKAELMRREFSANVTHELKSPLTSINGYAELISTGIAKDEDIKKFAQIIFDEGNRLLEIIDDILRLSKLDEKGLDLAKSYVDVKEEMDAIIDKFRQKSNKRNIQVTNNLTTYRVYTVKSLFVDLLSNIYENAIKYNKEGGSIEISSILIDRSMRIFIKDTGIGIKNSDIKRVFERFYVADKSRDRKVKSTGLGLSIAKHIADSLDFKLDLESRFGEGSTFIIEIPINDRG